jgi:nucleotide-binding universal stress UspA family protein
MKTSVTPGSVMVGVDGSVGSDAAVEWAAKYAVAHRRPLTIVHGAGAPVVTDFVIDLHEARKELRIHGRRVTDHALGLAQKAGPGLDIDVHLELREPRSLLAEAAEGAHLLVLGSRGHGAVLSLLLGSVSVALAAHAPCPVAVVRPAADDDEQRPVVVGIDGTSDSAGALTFAFELASVQHRRLEVVHAAGEAWLFPAPDPGGPTMVEEITSDWQLLLAESVAGYAEKFPDVVFSSRVVQGSPASALTAASEHASTVVVGARGRSALTKRLLGSVSRSVVEHAHCTVTVVRGATP